MSKKTPEPPKQLPPPQFQPLLKIVQDMKTGKVLFLGPPEITEDPAAMIEIVSRALRETAAYWKERGIGKPAKKPLIEIPDIKIVGP